MSRQAGVVAAGDPQTAAAGAELLRRGGNAIDAAVAAAFAAFVCEMPLCSPLGGGVLVVERAGGEAHALDLFARTPGLGGARPAALDFANVVVDFGAATQVFHVGRASAAVPVALPGLLEAQRRWGRAPLEEVLSPAIALGRDGYALGPKIAFVFEILEPIARRTPECFALYAGPDGSLGRAGDRLVNRDLASTLEDIARRPARVRELYAELARALAPERGGLFTERDVEEARAIEVAPIRVRHGEWELTTMPGPSTGGVLVALGLRLHEGAGRTPFGSSAHLLSVARVQEALLVERDARFDERCRDPAELAALLDERRIAAVRARLGGAGGPAPDSPLGSTTHVSAIDAEGLAASLTLTNGEGSGHVLRGTGMVVNNLLGEEDIHPRGFHVDPPGTRLTTMMAPSLLFRGEDRLALGSGGSNRLRNAILQVLLGVVEHGLSPEEAVLAPRVHLEALAGGRLRVALERQGMPDDAVEALTRAYPDAPAVFDAPNLYFGGVHVAAARDGRFSGAGDPRRGGAVAIAERQA